MSVLGAFIVRDDLHFRQRIGRWLHHLVRLTLVAGGVGVVVEAVQHEIVHRAPQAVDVERAFARGRDRRSAHARGQKRQLGVRAAIERQLLDLHLRQDLTPLTVVGRDQGGLRGHSDSLRNRPDLKSKIGPGPRSDFDLQALH